MPVNAEEWPFGGAAVAQVKRVLTAADHRRLFQRAADHASAFRDRVADRAPRPAISAAALQARFEGPTPEVGQDPLAVLDAPQNIGGVVAKITDGDCAHASAS